MLKIIFITQLLSLAVSQVVYAQNCDKNIEFIEVQQSSKELRIETKRLIFDQPRLIEHKDIYFSIKDSNRAFISFELLSNYKHNTPQGSKIGLVLGDLQVINLTSSNLEFSDVGTAVISSFDCQILSKEHLISMKTNGIKEIRFFNPDITYKLSPKEIKKSIIYANCCFNESFDGISYKSIFIEASNNEEGVNLQNQQYPENCFGIREEYDKFTLDTTYSSPSSRQIVLHKVRNSGEVTYFMTLTNFNNIDKIEGKGVIILLEGGIRIERPEVKIKNSLSSISHKYDYIVYIELSNEDVQNITTHQMTDFRIFEYDSSISKSERKKFIKYINCLTLNF